MEEIKGERKKELLETDIKILEDLVNNFKAYLERIDSNLYLKEKGIVEQEKEKVNNWIKEKEDIIYMMKTQLKNEFAQ